MASYLSNWRDVSSTYGCRPDTRTYLYMDPPGHQAPYMEMLSIVSIAMEQAPTAFKSEFLKAILESMT